MIRALLLEGDVIAHPKATNEVKAFALRAQEDLFRLRKVIGVRDKRHVLDDAAILDALFRPMYLGPPRSFDSRKKRGRPSKHEKTQYDEYADRRRSLYHEKFRLPAVRALAAHTRRMAGDVTRSIVFQLCREAQKNGATRRGCRKEVKRLAAKIGVTIPGEWQLGKLIADFFKVDTTT